MTCRKARASCDYLFLNRGRLSEEWVFDCCPLLAREHYYKISARVESMLYENRDMFVADLGGVALTPFFPSFLTFLPSLLTFLPFFRAVKRRKEAL